MEESQKSEYPSTGADKFIVRLPDGMRDLISAAAQANGRTMNAEVVVRLQRTFDQDISAKAAEQKLNDTIADLVKRFDDMSEKLAAGLPISPPRKPRAVAVPAPAKKKR